MTGNSPQYAAIQLPMETVLEIRRIVRATHPFLLPPKKAK